MPPIYTRTGDDGTAGLGDGNRVPKHALRLQACGTVDELNAAIGLARSLSRLRELDDLLIQIQNDLFCLGTELACARPRSNSNPIQITRQHVLALERLIDRLEKDLEPLTQFILPGGSPAGAALHLARTTCRRAERRVVELSEENKVGRPVLAYLNRLGDALFVLARWANRCQSAEDRPWQKPGPKR